MTFFYLEKHSGGSRGRADGVIFFKPVQCLVDFEIIKNKNKRRENSVDQSTKVTKTRLTIVLNFLELTY